MARRKKKRPLRERLEILYLELEERDDARGLLPWFADKAGGVSKSTVHRWLNADELPADTALHIEKVIGKLALEATDVIGAKMDDLRARSKAVRGIV